MRIIEFGTEQTENGVQFKESFFPDPNVLEWRGVTVFGEIQSDGSLHPMTSMLLAKAVVMAEKQNDKVQLLLIGNGLTESGKKYFANGVDRVFVYDDISLTNTNQTGYTGVLAHFIDNFKPAVMMFLATPLGSILSAKILSYVTSVGIQSEMITGYTMLPPEIRNSDKKGELVICEIPN